MSNAFYESIVQGIAEKVEKGSIVFSYIVGSKSWGATGCKDNDVIIVHNGAILYDSIYLKDINTDVFLYNVDFFRRIATGQVWHYSPYLGLAMACPKNILFGENPIENYNWFDYQKEVLYRMRKENGKFYFNKALCDRKAKGNCIKGMALALLAWYAIENQSFCFTAEQQETLQKCHDLQLPFSYAEELEYNIISKLEGWDLLE